MELFGLSGLPEFQRGDDLAAAICAAPERLEDGDLLIVTSKVVSKVEGRATDLPRDEAIDAETVAVVARRGSTRIVRNRLGLVLAAAGIDESNTDATLLLPVQPDASARRLRAEVAERLGIDVGVIVTDTAGRPWRLGQTDIAIGAAGIDPLQDLRGGVDASGRPLEVTMPAVADAIAAAADLVKGKSTGIPVAVLRGSNLVTAADGPGATALIRPESDDLFRHSGGELPLARRTVRSFRNDAVPQPAIDRAVAAAGTAPAPHHSRPWRFVQCSPATATRLLAALAEAWRADLAGDGFDEESIERRVARGAFLHEVPCLLIPCLVDGAAHDYPDIRRRAAEERMFLLSVGAGIQNLLLSLTDDGLGSAWVSSTLFAPDVARAALDLPADHQPMGAIAIGYPLTRTPPRPDPDGSDLLLRR